MQTGQFTLHENSFIAGDRKLVIKKRKKPSTKPMQYLIQVSPFQYISSLFPVSNSELETYTFDYEKKLYSLQKAGDKVEISELFWGYLKKLLKSSDITWQVFSIAYNWMYTREVSMTINELQVEKFLFSSLFNSNKDKVLSIRVEENMHELLQDLSKELETETVSDTVRKILNFYLLHAIYEAEWKKLHSKDFQKFLEEVAKTGDKVELQKYRNLLDMLSEYVQFMRSITDRMNITIGFFEGEGEKLEQVTSKLENVKIILENEKMWNEMNKLAEAFSALSC